MDTLLWRATFAHELFHMWNSHSLNMPNSPTLEWFKEGVTEFITYDALECIGTMSPSELEKAGMASFRKFANAFQNKAVPVSIAGAGANKGSHGGIVYNGGWTLALWLDRSLRRETDGLWDMVEFMNHVLTEFGPAGRSLSPRTLAAEVENIHPAIGRDFKTLVTSTDWNEIQELLARITHE